LSDIGLLLMALPGLLVLRFLISLFLYRQAHRSSPVVSLSVKLICCSHTDRSFYQEEDFSKREKGDWFYDKRRHKGSHPTYV
jgi:hypothetical protein